MNFRLKKNIASHKSVRTKKTDSVELAKYIIAYTGPVDQMRLQKLVYFVECYHLAVFREALIEDEFEAWMKGPISLKIWNYFKNLYPVFDPIQLCKVSHKKAVELEAQLRESIEPAQYKLINDVLDRMSGYSDFELECLAQSEDPWQKARKGYDTATICREIISKDSIREYYAARLNMGVVGTYRI